MTSKSKKKSPKWEIYLLIVLICINVTIFVPRIIERARYTGWPKTIDVEMVERRLLQPFEFRAIEEFKKTHIDMVFTAETAKEAKRQNRDYYNAERAFKVLKYNIHNSLFLRDDMTDFTTTLDKALSSGGISYTEARQLLAIIEDMNLNATEKFRLDFWR